MGWPRRARATVLDPPADKQRHVALLDTTGKTAKRVRAMDIGAELHVIEDFDAAVSIAEHNHCVLVVDNANATPEFFGDISKMRGKLSLPTIVVSERPSATLLRSALRAGVADVVGLNGSGADLNEALTRAWESGTQSRFGAPGHTGRIVTLFSAKGGVGCTTIAVNLAALMTASHHDSVVIDADLPFGDVSVVLGVDPRGGLADLTGTDLDDDRMVAAMTTHKSGVRVVPGPADPALAETITPTTITHAFDVARAVTDFVVVDTSCAFDDVTLAVLEASDEILLVTSPDLASIKNAKVAQATFKLLGIPEERVSLVVNRVGARAALGVSEVESQLGTPVVVIPDDDAFARAGSTGELGVVELPRSAATKALVKLAEHLSNGGR